MEPDLVDSNRQQSIRRTRSTTLQIQLAAAAVASSFLLLPIPNVETISLTAFLLGFLFPIRFAVGAVLTMVFTWEIVVSMILAFSGVTFPFKIVSWLLVMFIGVFARKIRAKHVYEFAIMGALVALIYDIIVTSSLAFYFVGVPTAFLPLLAANLLVGIPFTISHLVSNTIFFAFIPVILHEIIPILDTHYSYLNKVPYEWFSKVSEAGDVKIIDSIRMHPRRFMGYITVLVLIISLITAGLISQQLPDNDDPNEISVTFNLYYNDILPNETYELQIYSNTSVLRVLESISEVNVTFQFGNIPYVEAINNVWEDVNQTGNSWIYYVNDVYAASGAHAMFLSHLDNVEWRYVKIG